MSDNHNHPHTHDHGHEHSHPHSDHKENNAGETAALLNYMIDHNRHHGEDLHELLHSLEASGRKDAADLVGEALHFYDHGNEKLAEALKILGGK